MNSQQCKFAVQTDPTFAQNLASAYNYNIAKGLITNPVPAFANGNFVCFQDAANGCADVTKMPASQVNNLVSCKMIQSQYGPYEACFISVPGKTAEQLCQSFNPQQ